MIPREPGNSKSLGTHLWSFACGECVSLVERKPSVYYILFTAFTANVNLNHCLSLTADSLLQQGSPPRLFARVFLSRFEVWHCLCCSHEDFKEEFVNIDSHPLPVSSDGQPRPVPGSHS